MKLSLEVVIKAEADVVAIKIQTILAVLYVAAANFALAPTQETYVRNKRKTLVQVNCYTRTQTC